MWLRRLVGVMMIIICIGMNAVVVVGFFSPDKTKKAVVVAEQAPPTPPPVLTITAKPGSISAGSFSALTWTSSGNPTSCTASDTWSGDKTPIGAESTGRLSTPGNYKYTLTCKNAGGDGSATITVAVGPAAVSASSSSGSSSSSSSSSSSGSGATYCNGGFPCYGTADVAKHSSAGNCWGWLGNRVINVSSFDSAFHSARSGVDNIQVGGVCGKDLGPSVNGSVPANGYSSGHNHQLGAKSNTDANYMGYFVGYYDSSKP